MAGLANLDADMIEEIDTYLALKEEFELHKDLYESSKKRLLRLDRKLVKKLVFEDESNVAFFNNDVGDYYGIAKTAEPLAFGFRIYTSVMRLTEEERKEYAEKKAHVERLFSLIKDQEEHQST